MTTAIRETARLLAQDRLREIATRVALRIVRNEVDALDLDKLRSDSGLDVDGIVVWHRDEDDTVVTWAGNDLDSDMEWSVIEVQVPR